MSPLEVQTTSGPVLGFADTFPLSSRSNARAVREGQDGGRPPVLKWLGVPYASAERFQRPSPPKPWSAVREAFEFGDAFSQRPGVLALALSRAKGAISRSFVAQSEDAAHNVNVFAPDGTKPDAGLPVLVWVYGGALNNGTSDTFLYDPTEWIRRDATPGNEFIVVTLNYRTNIFGFFAAPELEASDPDGLTGNYGLYDVVAALEWVQANIAKFGGAPDRVTVFGESAGSFTIAHLLVSRRKLFQRAIMQSGSPHTMLMKPIESAYGAREKISAILVPEKTTEDGLIEYLRHLPTEELLDLHTKTYAMFDCGFTLETGPNATWTSDTLERYQRGEWDEWIEAVIIGTNQHEGTLYSYPMLAGAPAPACWTLKLDALPAGHSAFKGYVAARFPQSVQKNVIDHYTAPSATFDPDGPVWLTTSPLSRILADQIFVHPAKDAADALASTKNVKSGQSCKVFVYRLRAEVKGLSHTLNDSFLRLGAMHAGDLPLVFNVSSLWNEDAVEARASKEIGSRWVNFAVSGTPGPEWESYDPDNASWLAFREDGSAAREPITKTGWTEDRVAFA